MGATTFTCHAAGKTVDEAFKSAVADAHYWHGHDGYSGTIAEKSGWMAIKNPVARPTLEVAETLMAAEWDESARRLIESWYGPVAARDLINDVRDKWGNALAIELSKDEADAIIPRTPTGRRKANYKAWLFFGWASC